MVKIKDTNELKQLTAWLVQQPLVHWVQQRRKVSVRNKLATLAMQSEDLRVHKIWDRGITGANQIVGVADTGLDYDNCFFRDDNGASPKMCTGSGYVANCFDQTHRKIVTYRSFLSTDALDNQYGHGTHVVGSIVGQAFSTNQAETDFASQVKDPL